MRVPRVGKARAASRDEALVKTPGTSKTPRTAHGGRIAQSWLIWGLGRLSWSWRSWDVLGVLSVLSVLDVLSVLSVLPVLEVLDVLGVLSVLSVLEVLDVLRVLEGSEVGLMSWRHGSPPSWRRLQIPVGTAFHRRPSPRAAFDSTIAFVTFDELARCCYTVGEILEKTNDSWRT